MNEPGEGIKPEVDPRISTIKSFVSQVLAPESRFDIGTHYGLDLSDPRKSDIEAVRNGDFEVRNIKEVDHLDPNGERVHSYSFYLGKPGSSQTELHVYGENANLLEEQLKLTQENKT
jgi:hypothetical protein